MKPIFKVSLLAATILLAAGCQDDSKDAPAPAPTEQTTAADTTTTGATLDQFKTEDDKAAYTLGVSFSKYLQQSLDKQEELGFALNKDIIVQGINDSFNGTDNLTDEEIQKQLSSFEKKVSAKVAEQAKEQAKKDKAQAEENKKSGEAFQAEFEKESGVVKTESGLLYKVETEGEGDSPKATDTVEVNYTGTLIDGTKFDSSYDRGQSITFPLNRVIPGWTEALQLMKPGAKYKIVVPSDLAYGEQTQSVIPGNSTLIFDVELISVNPEPAEAIAK